MNLVLSRTELSEISDVRGAMPPAFGTVAAASQQIPFTPGAYEVRQVNWPSIGIVILVHAALLAALLSMNVMSVGRGAPKPIVVRLITMPPEPSLQELPVPPQKVKPQPSPVVVPPPIMRLANVPPTPVVVTPDPPPVRSVVVAPAPPAPAQTGPVSAPDLSETMVSGKPPKYPIESRRKHEQGTAVLNVLVGEDGAVASISIAKSSGFKRLDNAALEAVARWRWSPAMRNGLPTTTRGYITIPFVLA